MAFIYEVNGQKVQFDREPTEADIDEAARALRPAPVSAQPKPVEGAGGAAFGMYRPAGRRPESQNQNREDNKDMAIQTVRGAASAVPAVLGIPGSVANAIYNAPQTAQNLYNRYSSVQSQLAGNERQPLPETPKEQLTPYDMAFFSQMVPGAEPVNAAGQLAFAGGQALGAGRLPMDAYRGVRAGLTAARDVGAGALGRGFNYIAEPGAVPGPIQVPSSRVPIGSTYVDPVEFAAFQRGELPYGQMPQNRPISQLPQGRLDRAALAASGGEIPLQGQAARAFGERLGETYRSPVQAAADIGSMFLTGGIPVLTAGRTALAGVQGLADMRLAGKGFSPGVPGALANYRAGVTPMPGTPGPMLPPGGGGGGANAMQAAVQAAAAQRINNLPQLGYTPGAGSPTMYVSPEGVASTSMRAADQGGIAQKYPPMPGAQPAPVPAPAPIQQSVVERAQQIMGDRYRAPVAEQPITPIAPIETPPAPVAAAPVATAPVNTPAMTYGQSILNSMRPGEAKGKEITNIPYGKTPVTGDAYYEHYARGGLTPREAKYSPGTLSETLYNKVKQDPKSLTKEDIRAWSEYDMSAMPEFKVSKPTKNNPTPPTEADLVANVSKNIAANIIRDYEAVQAQTTKGRPELVGKTVEEAKAFDAARKEKTRQDQLKEELKQKADARAFEEAQQEAMMNKVGKGAKGSHEIPYKQGNNVITDIKQPGRNEIIVKDPAGTETSYITQKMGKVEQYTKRVINKDGQVISSESFDKKPYNWIKGLLDK